MSWSAYYIGTPEKIKEALNKYSESLNGMSKTEFDAALPHLIGLLDQNRNKSSAPVLNLSASGRGDSTGYNTCVVKIEGIPGILL